MEDPIIQTARELGQLGSSSQKWLDEYEDANVDIGCDREVLTNLMNTAPTEFARGVVAGRLMLLDQIAAVTGRS